MTPLQQSGLAALIAMALTGVATTRAAEVGPHQLTLDVTPLAQYSPTAGKANANTEVDIIGSFRLIEEQNGVLGDTRLAFWVLGNATLFGSPSTHALSQRARQLWDINDGDAPEPSVLLAMAALEQNLRIGDGGMTLRLGKLYPGNELAASDYYGDDRGTFFSQMIASDISGRWFDRIGLGTSISYQGPHWFGGALIADATAEHALLDVSSLRDGDYLIAGEVGVQLPVAGRRSRFSVVPYHIDRTTDFSAEKGLVLSVQQDLTIAAGGAPADAVLFGRFTTRTGGNPLNKEARDEAKPTRYGGFAGLALNRPFGWENQQIGLAYMQGAPSWTFERNGFGDQRGVEAYWKIAPGAHTDVTVDVQALSKKGGGVEIFPGLRLKLHM